MRGPSSRARLKGIALAAACVVLGALASRSHAVTTLPLTVYAQQKDEVTLRAAWEPAPSYAGLQLAQAQINVCGSTISDGCGSGYGPCPPTAVNSHYLDFKDLSTGTAGGTVTVTYSGIDPVIGVVNYVGSASFVMDNDQSRCTNPDGTADKVDPPCDVFSSSNVGQPINVTTGEMTHREVDLVIQTTTGPLTFGENLREPENDNRGIRLRLDP